MSRKLSPLDKDLAWQPPQSPSTTWSLTLTTITPMFGGSAEAREIGEVPIRAASVRGHLRFWWRATAGAQYATSEELYKAETALWGDTDHPGKVITRVDVIAPGTDALLRSYLPEKVPPRTGPEAGYFVFPFNEDNQGNKIANGKKDVMFTLTVSITPESQQVEEVRQAIKAWLTFGGIGARTRRGCGALTCKEKGWVPETANDVAFFRSLVPPKSSSRNFPVLAGGSVLLGEPGRNAEACWKLLGRFWARFRKGHFTEKRPEYNSMNGCEWRDHTTLKAQRNTDREIALAKPYLGLPIIYQKFSGSFAGTLESANSGRMASPVILKPITFADGTVYPMVAILTAPEPDAIKIGSRIITLKIPERASDPVLKALNVKHPLDAVWKAALESGFEEVKL